MPSRHGRMADLDPQTLAILMDAQKTIEQGREAGVSVEDTGEPPTVNTARSPQMTGFAGNTPNASSAQVAAHNAERESRARPPVKKKIVPDIAAPAPQNTPETPVKTEPPVAESPVIGSAPVPGADAPDKEPPVRITRQSFSGTPYDSAAPDGSPVAEISWCPSHGLFYPGKVYGQPLRMLDLLTVEGMTDENKMESLSSVLSRRLFGISSDEVLLSDEVFFLQWLRASTYPDDIIRVPGFTCPHCKAEITEPDYGVNFKYLSFNTDNDPDEVFAMHREYGYYPFRMSDGAEVRMFITRRLHDQVTSEYMAGRSPNYSATKPRSLALPGIPDEFVAPIANMAAFLEIDGCKGMDAKVTYLANLSGGEDMDTLKKAMDAAQLRTTVKAKLICPRCHEVTEAALPFSLAEYVSGL